MTDKEVIATALAELGYDPSETDLVENIRRYKRWAEGEIALRDEGAKKLGDYAERLQALIRPESVLKIAGDIIELDWQ